jgi:hypothetical protein
MASLATSDVDYLGIIARYSKEPKNLVEPLLNPDHLLLRNGDSPSSAEKYMEPQMIKDLIAFDIAKRLEAKHRDEHLALLSGVAWDLRHPEITGKYGAMSEFDFIASIDVDKIFSHTPAMIAVCDDIAAKGDMLQKGFDALMDRAKALNELKAAYDKADAHLYAQLKEKNNIYMSDCLVAERKYNDRFYDRYTYNDEWGQENGWKKDQLRVMHREYGIAYEKAFNTKMQSPLAETPFSIPNKDGDVPDDDAMDAFDAEFIASFKYVPDQLSLDMQLMKEKFGVDMATATSEQIHQFSDWKARQEKLEMDRRVQAQRLRWEEEDAAERKAAAEAAANAANDADDEKYTELYESLLKVAQSSDEIAEDQITRDVVNFVQTFQDDGNWDQLFTMNADKQDVLRLKMVLALVQVGVNNFDMLAERLKSGNLSFLEDPVFLLGFFEKGDFFFSYYLKTMIEKSWNHGCSEEHIKAAQDFIDSLQ